MSAGIAVALVVFALGLVAGLPLCWVFLAASVAALYVLGESLVFVAGAAFFPFDNYLFMAIAFFVFAGALMSESGIADRFVRFSHALVGHIRGGLVDVGVMATLFLSALTGSSVPCVAALVPLLVPRLEQYGIQRRYSTAVLCSSSFLGYLIPPSVPALIYCMVAQQSVAALLFTWALVALTVIDLDHQILPDIITLPLLWLGLLLSLAWHAGLSQPIPVDPASAIIGGAAGYLTLWSVYWAFKLLTGKEGMGYGDFKLFGAFGAWMGWQMLPLILLLSAFAGAVVGIVLIVARGRDRNIPIPFGPYLAAAGWIALMWGPQIVSGYLSMSGLDR